ncbi:hypothetical protein KI387_033917, partial [Taxus chinensis]
MAEVVTVNLSNGAKMPVVGFGSAFRAKDSASVENFKASVLEAIQVGYRTFDTASVYFTEGLLGESLKEAFEKGLVSRHEVFVTSKLWCGDCYPQDVIPALKKSLQALKLEYLDLYLIHWPVAVKKGVTFINLTPDDAAAMDIQGVWREMEECVELGLTRAIGVSNFSSKKIEDLLTYSKIPPAVNQVEMHPLWQQEKLRGYCNSVNVHVSAWAPLGGPGNSWGTGHTLDNPLIKDIATKHDKTSAQVALRWGIEKGVSVITRSFNSARILHNFQIFDWKLDEEDHQKIGSITQQLTEIAKN